MIGTVEYYLADIIAHLTMLRSYDPAFHTVLDLQVAPAEQHLQAIWHYLGIDTYTENHNEDYVRWLGKYNEHSLVLSIGLWADAGALSPAQLEDALAKCTDIPWVSITPASLMVDGHWRVLQRQRG